MSERWKNVLSVLTLVVGFVAALALSVGAFLVSFCGLWGEPCTSSEENAMALLGMASLGVFLFVPALVATLRRQARWMLAPVIEIGLILGFFGVLGAF